MMHHFIIEWSWVYLKAPYTITILTLHVFIVRKIVQNFRLQCIRTLDQWRYHHWGVRCSPGSSVFLVHASKLGKGDKSVVFRFPKVVPIEWKATVENGLKKVDNTRAPINAELVATGKGKVVLAVVLTIVPTAVSWLRCAWMSPVLRTVWQ